MENSGVQQGKIYEALCNVMAEITPVEKSEQGQGVPYKFRSIYGILNMIQPLMAKNKVYIRPEVLEKESNINEIEKDYWDDKAKQYKTKKQYESHVMVRVKYSFVTIDGSDDYVITEGEGVDYGDKALNKSMTSALKNALQQMFAIPTDDMSDSEYEDIELEGKGKEKPAGQKKPKDQQANGKSEQPNEKPNFENFVKRIQEIDNIFELNNWGKKHSAEIKTFKKEDQESLRTLYAERSKALNILALAEKVGVSHFDLKEFIENNPESALVDEAFQGNKDALQQLTIEISDYIENKEVKEPAENLL